MAEVSDKSVKLEFSDGTPSVTLPVLTGSVGPDAIDISTLYKQTGKFTYDPGFMATAAVRLPTLTVMPANSFTAAIPLSSSPKSATSWKSAICF